MPKGRKTFNVQTFATTLQVGLDNAKTSEARAAFVFALSDLLFQTDNYHGYHYRNGYNPGDPNFDEFDRVYYTKW